MPVFNIVNYSIGKYCEATDYLDPHLTLLEENGKDLHCLFKACRCKDFFNEVFNKIYTGNDSTIYDFSTNNIDVSKVKDSEYFYLLMVSREANDAKIFDAENIQNFLDLFNPKSQVVKTNMEKGIVIRFHRNWTDRPYLLSMFLNLCRIGSLYNNEGWESFKQLLSSKGLFWKQGYASSPCLNQVANSLRVIEDYLNGIVHEQAYSDYSNTNDLHNRSGAVSFTAKLK